MPSPLFPERRTSPSTASSCCCLEAACPAHEGRRIRVIDWVKGLSRLALWDEGTVIGCPDDGHVIVELDTFPTPRAIPIRAVEVLQDRQRRRISPAA